MRLLVLSFYYEPDLCAGSFRTTALVKSLVKQLSAGSHVNVITTLPNRYDSFEIGALELENTKELSIERVLLPKHKSGFIDQAKAFVFYAKEVIRRVRNKEFDAIYATSSRLMTATLGAYLSSKLKIPLYLDIRDIFVDTLKDVLPRKVAWFLVPLFSIVEEVTIKKASHINLVSRGFESYFRQRYPHQCLSFFLNGIDDEFLVKNIEDPAEVRSKKIILYAGNIGDGQGLHKVLPALAFELRGHAEFIVVGDGGKKRLLLEALRASNTNNVKLLDPVSRKELICFYKQADVLFLHLNNYDAFKKVLPSKLFEYGAVGKPILAGVSGFASEFIKQELDNAEVFFPCNAKQGKEAFLRLKLMTNPRYDFIEKYSRKKIMKNMATDIIRVLGRKQS